MGCLLGRVDVSEDAGARPRIQGESPRIPRVIPPIVDLAWLREHAEAVRADVRYYLDGRSGRAAYESGHLPGAVFVDVDTQLAAHGADPDLGRHPLPDPDAFAGAMGSLGIADDDVVVAYDDEGGIMAARLVWMLRATGHDAALLDGGIAGLGRTARDRDAAATGSRFTARPFANVASIDDAADTANVVVDARQRERFHGEPTRSTSARATSRAPAASRAARTSPKRAACSPRTRCARSSARSASTARRRWSPTAAQA